MTSLSWLPTNQARARANIVRDSALTPHLQIDVKSVSVELNLILSAKRFENSRQNVDDFVKTLSSDTL